MAFPSGPPSPSSLPTATSVGPTSGTFWATSYYGSGDPNWKMIIATGIAVDENYPEPGNLPKLIWRNSENTTFSKDKSYQFITEVNNFSTQSIGVSFSINTSWGEFYDYEVTDRFNATELAVYKKPPFGNPGQLYFYSKPSTDLITRDLITYKANNKFGIFSNNEYIHRADVKEIDFEVHGFAWWRDADSLDSTNLNLSPTTDGQGWSYYDDTKSYVWFSDSSGYILPLIKGKFGSGYKYFALTQSYQNCLITYIRPGSFNLSFTYNKLTGDPTDGIDIYLSQEYIGELYWNFGFPNGQLIPDTAQLIASYTQSGSTFSAYFGLTGKQYLIIKASQSTSSTQIALTDIQISGEYWSGNNRNYVSIENGVFSDPEIISPNGLVGATFSLNTGFGNTYNATQSLEIQQLSSKIGNGRFMAGIWENGVWNSGWRKDENLYEMYYIGQFFSYNRDQVWRFEIKGLPSVLSQFNVGDKISIGNIVAIDYNEERKLITKYFSILGKTSTSLVVELTNNFPLKRIEKDSPYHRITITKNIWSSGVFLNGYFEGIWNSGLFKGYPLITEMYNSNWIDGTFDGGHFKTEIIRPQFSGTFFVPGQGGRVGLTFSEPHRLQPGDFIVIDKTDKTKNPTYDGTASIVSVLDDYRVVTNKIFRQFVTQSETGNVYTSISTGLIQNFNFKSNNVSELSSNDYLDSDAVFLYDSWIDVSYYTYSAVNIGRDSKSRNEISLKEYSTNNLYGYPTDDVLSSVSTFRNSYNNNQKTYKLGTKYKIYNDYVGDSSSFESYFDSSSVDASKFLGLGWTYSSAGPNSIVFSRSLEVKATDVSRPGYPANWVNVREDLLSGSQLQIDARASGGVLNLSTPLQQVNFRNVEEVEKGRYTMIEFDLSRWSASSSYYEMNDGPTFTYFFSTKYKFPNQSTPILHFDNLNVVKRNVTVGTLLGEITALTTVPASYLPVYQNIDHIQTPVSKKVEYFYNKTNLSLNLRGSGWYGSSTASIVIDNLKYYEVDMIPFFQYFTENNINLGVQIPYQGIAPLIDYSNADFQFLDNISLGFDSFQINSSNLAVSGVGVGLGTVPADSIFDIGVLADTGNTAGDEAID